MRSGDVRASLLAQKMANGRLHLFRVAEMLAIKTDDMEFDGDEFQSILIGNNDAHGNALEFYSLLFHETSLPVSSELIPYSDTFTHPEQVSLLRALHKKGVRRFNGEIELI